MRKSWRRWRSGGERTAREKISGTAFPAQGGGAAPGVRFVPWRPPSFGVGVRFRRWRLISGRLRLSSMIRSFRHKGLKLLFEDGSRRGVRAGHADRIERILARLDQAS